MNVVQVTSSGQISIPKALRSRFKTKFFTCELTSKGVLFKPLEEDRDPFEKKYTIKDLRKAMIPAKKGAKKDGLSMQIDQIVYGI